MSILKNLKSVILFAVLFSGLCEAASGPFYFAEKDEKKLILFGTVHYGTKEVFSKTEEFAARWMVSGVYTLYTEAGDIGEGAITREMALRYKQGRRASEVKCDSEIMSRWNYLLSGKVDRVSRLSFFFTLYQLMPMYSFDKEIAVRKDLGSEAALVSFSKKNNIKIDRMEVAELADVVDEISDADICIYAESALATLDGKGVYTPQSIPFAELLKKWFDGDVDWIDKIGKQKELEYVGGNSKLLIYEFVTKKRNEIMAAKIDDILAHTGDVPVVAVGAAHLSGERGLIELLERRGFKVTQGRW